MIARSRMWVWPLAIACLAMVAGCSSYHTKFGLIPGGEIEREHGRPMEGGYYQDFDPDATTLEVTPAEATNPVGTQHVLVATVKDADGNPLHSRRVEWMIAEGSVGSIVEVDESGWYKQRGYKVDNTYAVSHTNRGEHTLTRGTEDTSDDIHLKEGQTWCVITSPTEGDTNVIAFAPAIHNWDKHKVFVVKHWNDAEWQWPDDAVNRVGEPHELAVKVMRHSDKSPIEGWVVNYEIVDGPAATLEPGDGQSASVKTDGSGVAKVTLNQTEPAEGRNTIRMEVVRPADTGSGATAMRLAEGTVTKTWVGPRIGITKTGASRAMVGQEFSYSLVVNNPGKVEARNVRVTDEVPEGLDYVSSSPEAQRDGRTLSWSLDSLAAGARERVTVNVQATRTGTFENCAQVTADGDLSDRDCATTQVTAPALSLEKSGPAEVLICEPIEYRVVVRNTGDGPAENVKVTDQLPDGLETQSGRDTIMVDVGALDAGQAKQATYTVRATRRGSFTNTAVAAGDPDLRAEAQHTVTVVEPVLEVTKTGPEERFVDRNVEYQITVRNTGNGPARNTVLTDQVPDGMTFVSASDGGQASGGAVKWSLGTIDPGQSRNVTVTLKGNRKGTMTNRVTATATCAEASDEFRTTISGIPALLLETVDQDDPIEIGNEVTYKITVTNQGSADGTNVQIICTLPAEQEFVSSRGATDATVEDKRVTFTPLPSLGAKKEASWYVTVRATAAGDVRFETEMNADQLDSPVRETESTNLYE